MAYKATYFDGKTSFPHPVVLKLSGQTIEVFDSEELIHKLDEWNTSECRIVSFNAGSNILFARGDFPEENLQVDGMAANNIHTLLSRFFDNRKQIYDLALRGNQYLVIVVGLIVLSVLTNYYIKYVSPFVGDQIVKVIPKAAERGIGDGIINNYGEYYDLDEERSVLLQRFYDTLNFESEYDIKLHFSNVDLMNAFATPGGHIVVFKGIIYNAESWEELAALLGHELAHVNHRHSFKMITRGLGNYVLFSAVTGDMAGLSSSIMEGANQLYELSNSRGFEREADIEGLKSLVEAKIRPEAATDLFERLNDYTAEGYTEIFSTHPIGPNRVDYIQRIIKRNKWDQIERNYNAEAQAIFTELQNLIQEDYDSDEEEDLNTDD